MFFATGPEGLVSPRKQKIQTSHDDVVRNDVIMTSELKFEMPQHS